MPGNILLPKDTDMNKWSVIACDQYTSEPEYWESVKDYVGDNPSTLKITLPEIYLECDDVAERIKKINSEIESYVKNRILCELPQGYVYVERTLLGGQVRKGIMGVVDLQEYDYSVGSQTLIRATEGTILGRIPPRKRVRENAAIETPHIILLIDDEQETVIEPLVQKKDDFEMVYDFQLMKQSGSIKGFFVDKETEKQINEALIALAQKDAFEEKYQVDDKGVLLFAVGDGNHSLATAKACYKDLKKTMSQSEWENHPARYALVEIENVHDEALEFEAIHRVVFEIDADDVVASLESYYDTSYEPCDGQSFEIVRDGEKKRIWIKNPVSNLAIGTLQSFLDDYIKNKVCARVDYIHGQEVVVTHSKKADNIGFLLPDMAKSDLFKTVVLDGVLPRKTFSMGHAWDKRFYLECRKIK
jgi:uncharacterized protein (DUF1015 family)